MTGPTDIRYEDVTTEQRMFSVVIIRSDIFSFHYSYFPTIASDGTEYRHCFSSRKLASGFAVWHEASRNGRLTYREKPTYVDSKTTATELAQARCKGFRERVSPCVYHQIIVDKAAFARSMIKEEYRTLRKWMVAQGLSQGEFVISFHRDHYIVSFGQMGATVQNVLLFLKMNSVLIETPPRPLVVEYDGRLQDLSGYKA